MFIFVYFLCFFLFVPKFYCDDDEDFPECWAVVWDLMARNDTIKEPEPCGASSDYLKNG